MQTDFDTVYGTFEKPIYNYLLRMVKDEIQAKDLAQEVFIKVYKNLGDFRGEAELSTWIYRIATNSYLDHFRTSGFKKNIITDEWVDENTSVEIDKKILSIEEEHIKTQMNSCIQGYLNDIPDDYRAVIALHDLQGLKNREIADVLDITLDTVKIRLHRARKKFRSVLAMNCEFYHDEDNAFSCDRKGVRA